jgi:hypothetical protein
MKTNQYRYRDGLRFKWTLPVIKRKPNISNEIAVGDFIAVSTKGSGPLSMIAGIAYPFSNFSNSDIASIADYFLGIADNESLNEEDKNIVVDTRGEFKLSLRPTEKPSIGMYARVREGLNSIEAQEVILSITDSTNSIGRVSRSSSSYESDIRVQIKSAIAGEIN